jgi:hypothetical protein
MSSATTGFNDYFDFAQYKDGTPVTTSTGPIVDQAALHGVLARIRDMNLPLILRLRSVQVSVNQVELSSKDGS